MAKTQESYRLGSRNQRFTTKLNAFANGMYLTEQVIPEGYVKKMINYDIDATGSHIKPRRGRKVVQTITPDFEPDLYNEQDPLNGFELYRPPEIYGQINVYETDWAGGYEKIPTGLRNVGINRSHRGVVLDRGAYVGKFNYIDNNVSIMRKQYMNTHYIQDTASGSIPAMPIDRAAMIIANNEFYCLDYSEDDGRTLLNNYKLVKSEVGWNTYNYSFILNKLKLYKPNALEAANYGYNMLLDEPYLFENQQGGSLAILGGTYHILSPEGTYGAPVLFPELGSSLLIEVNYQYPKKGVELTCKVEICDASDPYSEWETVMEDGYAVTGEVWQVAPLTVKYRNMAVRITATPENDKTKSTTGSFQILAASDINNIELKPVDITSGEAMCSWLGYIGVYKIPGSEDSIFFSDINNPGYFPFPSNAIQFDKEILAVHNYLDNLLVVTVDSLYLVTIGSTIRGSIKKKIMTNVYISEIDAINIQILKDQIFFKTGNKFYVLKPNKYTSDATDLKNYVISTAIDNLMENFDTEIIKMLNEEYKTTLQKLTKIEGAEVRIAPCIVNEVDSYIMDQEVHYVYELKFWLDNQITHDFIWYMNQGDCDYYYGNVQLHLVYDTLVRSWRTYLVHGNAPTTSSAFESSIYPKGENDFYKRISGPITGIKPFHDTELDVYYEVWWIEDPNIQLYSKNAENCKNPYNTLMFVELTYKEVSDVIECRSYPELDNSPEPPKELDQIKIYSSIFYDNYPYIDTGIIAIEDIFTKRFREVQFNLVNRVNDEVDPNIGSNMRERMIPFHVDFKLDGQERVSATRYRMQHITDKDDPNYGQIFIIPIEVNNMYLYGNTGLANTVEELDYWRLDLSKFPELSMVTVRFELKGRGRHASLQLLNTSLLRYELSDINWVYRTMSAR